jgi:hypothetical protein
MFNNGFVDGKQNAVFCKYICRPDTNNGMLQPVVVKRVKTYFKKIDMMCFCC